MPTTAVQQLMLEMINRARTDPAGEFDELIQNASTDTAFDPNVTSAIRFFDVDLDLFQSQLSGYTSVAPLAWNDNLAQSAQTHTELMVAEDTQSHNLPGEPGLLERFQNAGYDNIRLIAENIFAFAENPLYAHAGFYIDWGYGPGGIQDPAGHREAILNGTFTEIGISWVAETDPSTSVGPFLTTQHLGTRWDYEAQLLGVVIDDTDNDDFYDIGEGLGGVTITATGTSGEGTYVTTSWDSGGYQMVLPDGTYTVVFSGGALGGTVTTTVTIDGENVKVDAEADDAVAPPPDTPMDIEGDNGDNLLVGGGADDTIDAGRGNDTAEGLDGDDAIFGFGGDDSLFGNSGNDTIRGGRQNDFIDGGSGNDELYGQRNIDTIMGGSGDDRLNGGGGRDELYGESGNDWMRGGTKADFLDGGSGNDTLETNRHDDTLIGGAGDDSMNAGGDDDRLIGGTGDDWMRGGTGEDVFVFDEGHGADVIDDFSRSDDRLEISSDLADGMSAAQIASAATVTSDGVLIDFGDGDTILLDGLGSTTGLESQIDII